MADAITARLKDRGIALPEPMGVAGNYVPAVITGNLVFISGQVSIGKETRYIGKLGADYGVEEGQVAARTAALNILAQLNAALDGALDRVTRCVKVGGFVNSVPEFDQQPAVINGASDFFVEVFGEKAKHARFAVSAPSLPFGVAVEVDAIFEIAP